MLIVFHSAPCVSLAHMIREVEGCLGVNRWGMVGLEVTGLLGWRGI